MTTPTSPPAGSRLACPLCATPYGPLPAGRCSGCGADLADPAAARIAEIDRSQAALSAEREALAVRLAATRPAGAPPPTAARPVWEQVGTGRVLPPGPVAAGPPAPPARRHLGVPALLAIAGVALLTAAAIVFTAVAWTTLPAAAQAAVLVVAAAIAAAAAVTLDRRQIPTAAGALGTLSMSLAAVLVVGVDRTGAASLGAYTVPVAAAAAALVGWALGRTALRWVSTAGAAAALVAMVSATVEISESFELLPVATMLVTTAAALATAATVPAWRTTAARRLAGVGASVWLTVAGLIGVVALAEDDTGLLAGLGALALPILLLVAAARWQMWLLAPAIMLVTSGTVASAAHLGVSGLQLGVVAAAVVTVVLWGVFLLSRRSRAPLLVGTSPVAAIALLGGVWELGVSLTRLTATIAGTSFERVDPWGAALLGLVVLAALAVPAVRGAAAWVVLPAVLALSATLPVLAAAILLLALATVALAVEAARRRGMSGSRGEGAAAIAGWDPLVPLVAATAAVGWSAAEPWSVAASSAVSAMLATAVAVGVVTRVDHIRREVALGLALAAGGLTAGAVTHAGGADLDLALGVGAVVVMVATVATRRLVHDASAMVTPIVAAAATIVVPASATTLRASGVLLLIAAVGWLGLAVTGWRPARWIAAAVASAGSATLLADAEVELVEAYVAVPALSLAAIGVWMLVEDRTTRTAVALLPALTVGLLPSLVSLSADPEVLQRTLALTVVAGVLAAVGLRMRWLAPTVAGALAALWVAITQLVIVVEVVPRWVTFAAVGLLLVWLAATYEGQQARARALRRTLMGFR